MAWSVSSGPWLCESSPIREVELIQQRLDIDAQLAQIDQAARLPELEEAFVNVAASWAKRTGISAAALREVGVPASVLRPAGLLYREGRRWSLRVQELSLEPGALNHVP
jgi:hypothetical protein